MQFIGGAGQQQYVARTRALDPCRCLAAGIDVGKYEALCLIADHRGEVVGQLIEPPPALVEALNPRESGSVAAPRKYPNELRERALRLVTEAMAEDPELSLNGAVHRIGPRVGIVPDTLRGWAKQARVDARVTPGTTTSDARRLKELEQEVKELRRANEILLAASSFFARELDPRLPW